MGVQGRVQGRGWGEGGEMKVCGCLYRFTASGWKRVRCRKHMARYRKSALTLFARRGKTAGIVPVRIVSRKPHPSQKSPRKVRP